MKLGFVFPGQGSQSVGMLKEIAAEQAVIEETFAEAAEVLELPLWQLASEGPQEELNRTELTQPLLLTASVALWRAWQANGGAAPSVLAGHSLGEYSALVCAEALPFAQAVALVRERGRLMQAAVPMGEGAMAAILGLDDAEIQSCCDAVDGIVSPANFNAPGQTVIAGAAAAVEAAVSACSEAGARRAVLLQVSGPFHCELMAPAAEPFAAALAATSLSMPKIPVVHNVDAQVAEGLPELKDKLLRQIAEPVRWSDCVLEMRRLGAEGFVECGAGKVLAGLIKRIEKGASVAGIEAPAAFRDALAQTEGEA